MQDSRKYKGKQKIRYILCTFYLGGVIEGVVEVRIQAAKMKLPLGTFILEHIVSVDVNALLALDETPSLATLEALPKVAGSNLTCVYGKSTDNIEIEYDKDMSCKLPFGEDGSQRTIASQMSQSKVIESIPW